VLILQEDPVHSELSSQQTRLGVHFRSSMTGRLKERRRLKLKNHHHAAAAADEKRKPAKARRGHDTSFLRPTCITCYTEHGHYLPHLLTTRKLPVLCSCAQFWWLCDRARLLLPVLSSCVRSARSRPPIRLSLTAQQSIGGGAIRNNGGYNGGWVGGNPLPFSIF
jgi:hypothetical protein